MAQPKSPVNFAVARMNELNLAPPVIWTRDQVGECEVERKPPDSNIIKRAITLQA